ncbi:electron transport complex protein RnfB [Nitrococcus mobilis Nb-231]|uniref:Electron transport complex protein RnfB n=2 Tax=Nitrococcus mobilis TaxID=35797 RepID=A4BN62_9GAMM|nr:electron transport complex protein RnfB [Nitrococcus mobilis Nb-231]
MSFGMLTASATALTRLAAAAGWLFGWRTRRHGKPRPDAEQIDAILPQTQCGRCGYSACRPYAEAIARGEADINQCPPGGELTVHALAELLGRKPKPLNPKHGTLPQEPTVAWIDETACIGCTRCIQACPVDAILGTAKQMHTVIRTECTGCALCIAPCPVDCIHLRAVTQDIDAAQTRPDQNPAAANISCSKPQLQSWEQLRDKADRARERYEYRLTRLARERDEREQRQQSKKAIPGRDLGNIDKKAVIQAAVARARRRQAALATARGTSLPPRPK